MHVKCVQDYGCMGCGRCCGKWGDVDVQIHNKKKMNVRVLRELVISVAHKLSDDMVGRYDEVVTLKKVI